MTTILIGLAALAVLMVKYSGTKHYETAYINGSPQEIEVKGIGKGLLLRADAADAFNSMVSAALLAGIGITPSGPRAAFRTDKMQLELLVEQGIYGQGGTAAKVGYSPHQRGIAVDLANVTPWGSGYLPEVRAWLLTHGPSYGWHNVGAQFSTPEPWHFEYRS